jgi:hypothetical protein
MHLAKPVDPRALVAAVSTLAQAARSSGSAGSLKLSCPA